MISCAWPYISAKYLAPKKAQNQFILIRQSIIFFSSYSWPGNVRELKNLIERLTILYPDREIGPAHLPKEIGGDDISESANLQSHLELKEKNIILATLAESNGRKGLAAEKLGISRHALKRRMQRLGMA